MDGKLQDQKVRLQADIIDLDDVILSKQMSITDIECQEKLAEADEYHRKSLECVRWVNEHDREQKRRELLERDAIAAAKREKLLSQIAEQERLYRDGVTRGLRVLEIFDPGYAFSPVEKAILANPAKASLVGLPDAFWRNCPSKCAEQYTAARRNLAKLRSAFAALGA